MLVWKIHWIDNEKSNISGEPEVFSSKNPYTSFHGISFQYLESNWYSNGFQAWKFIIQYLDLNATIYINVGMEDMQRVWTTILAQSLSIAKLQTFDISSLIFQGVERLGCAFSEIGNRCIMMTRCFPFRQDSTRARA